MLPVGTISVVMSDYPKQRLLYLQEMGIPFYVRRRADLTAPPPRAAPSGTAQATADGLPAAWLQLYAEVHQCSRCVLHEERTRAVPGSGDVNAGWMLVGEAPGVEEDRKGEPFVGRAGQLLNKMLKTINLERSQVYITNIVKCRPPDNRNPRPEEMRACADYLQHQIHMVRPGIILALGRTAANALLQRDDAVGKLRGQVHRYRQSGPPVVVTYHPAYLLRSPHQKRAAWEDLKLACRTFGNPVQ